MDAIMLPATLKLPRSVFVSSPDAPPPDVRIVRNQLYLERELSIMRSDMSYRQQKIFDLAVNGLNVFPVPWRSKGGTRWKFMQYLYFEPHQIPRVFSMRYYNVALMMGFTSGNLFALDLERDSTLNHFIREFQKRNLPIVYQRSGKPGGGGHLLARCQEGEVINLPKSATRVDWEVRGHRNYVLVAPSIHPQGTPYHWVEGNSSQIPFVSIEDLRWLGLELYTERKARIHARNHDPTVGLCNDSQDFIRSGAPETIRNINLYKTACDLSGCGYTQQEAREKAGTAAYLSGLGWPEIDATLDSAYCQPRTPSRQYAMQNDLMPKWMIALIFALDRLWEGGTATTDRAVFIAACLCAQASSKDGVYRASCREVAEKAHVDKSVAAEALHRLQDMGLLKHVGADGSSSAFLYAFNWEQINAERRRLQKTDTQLAPAWGGIHVRLLQKLLDTDLPERGSLGWPGLLLYVNLVRAKRHLKAKEMMALSNLSQAQVYRALDKLKEAGMAFEVGKTHTYRVVVAEPEVVDNRISVPRGAAGRSERRKKKHREERQRRAERIIKEDMRKWQGRDRWFKSGLIPIAWRAERGSPKGVSRWQRRGFRFSASPDQRRLL
jgi:predicted transcriptional regulator